MDDASKNIDMASEPYHKAKKPEEYWIVPKTKKEYIKEISDAKSPKEQINAFNVLVEDYHYRGEKRDGHYSVEDRKELLVLIDRYISFPDRSGQIAYLAMQEGCYCEKVGDYASATEFYKISFRFVFEDSKLHYFQHNNYGYCLNFNQKFSEAEEVLRIAVEIQPERYNAWKNLGVSLEHQGQFEEAAECYLKAITFSRGEQRSIKHLGRLIERYPSLMKVPAIAELFTKEDGD